MASQPIPSSKSDEFVSRAMASLLPMIEGIVPDLKKIDIPHEAKERLIFGPLKKLTEDAEARFGSRIPDLSDEVVGFTAEKFFEILTTIAKEGPEFPPNTIAPCGVDEAAFTHALDPRPIVATEALATCVGIAGYDRENQFGFVIHFAGEDALEASKDMLTEKIKQMSKEPISHPIEIHLRGGIAGQSESLVHAIEEWIGSIGLPIEIVSKEVLTVGLLNASGIPNMMSISLDTRDGTINTYDSSTNPYAEPKCQIQSAKEVDDLFSQLFEQVASKKPEIKIVYSPLG